MYMKTHFNPARIFRIILSAALLLPLSISCNKENPSIPEVPYFCDGNFYLLNNGKWGNNDASIGRFDDLTPAYYPSAFYGVNKQHLGDLGQDMLVYGSKIYIAVSGSKKIFVTDKDLKLIKTLDPDNCQPRHLEAYKGKLYVSLYEGYLAEIDTTTYQMRKVEVGDSPEGFCIDTNNGMAYVACSGGMSYPDYGNKVTIINLSSFSNEAIVTTNLNPQGVWCSNGKQYILSWGNYKDVPAKLQIYKYPNVMDLPYENVYACALYGDILYIMTDIYSETGAKIIKHSTVDDSNQGNFLPSNANIQNAYSLSVTKSFVWIGISDYVNPGDMSVWNRTAGSLHRRFGTFGLNPQKAIELYE